MQNWLSASGIVVFTVVAWVLSEDRKNFPWRVVIWGLLLQFVFGFLVLYWEPGTRFFLRLNDVFNALLNFSKQGAQFVFGALGSTDAGDTPVSLKEYLTRGIIALNNAAPDLPRGNFHNFAELCEAMDAPRRCQASLGMKLKAA